MSAPRQAESIPTVTAPVVIPDAEPEMSRGRFLVGVITGGVLFVLAAVLLVVAAVVTS